MLLNILGPKNFFTRFSSSTKLLSVSVQRCWNSTALSAETVDLAYASYESTSDSENSSQPPLVILHGLLGSKNNWNSMSKAIHRTTGRKVISVDARNHGDSRHSPQHTYVHMAHDVMRLLKKLELSKVSLLGHSMGGRTAMVLSLLCSDLVASLIVVDISPAKTSPQIFSMATLFDAMTAVSIRPGIAMSKARKLADDQLKSFTPDINLRNFLITNLVQTNAGSFTWRVNIPALKDNFQNHISSFPSNLKGLQYCGPTLFVGGSLSDYIGKNDLPEIQEYFPLADLIFIEGAGHWVHSQKPEKFLEMVSKFLTEK
ncbi:abhydrolase domain containing 11 [Bombyx mori]|uniref:sn-1-specific diacylglycerol lipase ABHD11 n=1 Tax=Bombyx mori TaxID=7091 RepID=Q1HQD1_BOMMO|nr:abhydrolase domain containing 11 [Bombyx mori]ABF51210.1 abhydrolase domain containing 11 [Bombyx mori]